MKGLSRAKCSHQGPDAVFVGSEPRFSAPLLLEAFALYREEFAPNNACSEAQRLQPQIHLPIGAEFASLLEQGRPG